MMGALLQLFTEEACDRAREIAKVQGADEVDIDHLEAVLAQLLLDFS